MLNYSSYIWLAYGFFIGMLIFLSYRARRYKHKTFVVLKRWFSRSE